MNQTIIQTGLDGAGSVRIKSGMVAGNFYFPGMFKDIISTLKFFNRDLYFGYMHRNVFLYSHYLHAKQGLLEQFINIDDLRDDQIRNLGFSLYMTRTAQTQKWRYPALLNRNPSGQIEQITGNTRALASLMVHDKPWEKYPVLFAEHPDFDPGKLLNDPIHIDSDKKLNEIFNLDPEENEWEPRVHLNLHLQPFAGEFWCKLDYIGDGTYHDHAPRQGQGLLDEYQRWRAQYKFPVKLAIYTQWPDRLINVHKIWDVEIVGTSEGMLIDDRLAYAERTVRDYHQSPVHEHTHVLWVITPRTIDLSDLLMWVDTVHSTYISSDWSFILHRNQEEYLNTFINVSQQEG